MQRFTVTTPGSCSTNTISALPPTVRVSQYCCATQELTGLKFTHSSFTHGTSFGRKQISPKLPIPLQLREVSEGQSIW